MNFVSKIKKDITSKPLKYIILMLLITVFSALIFVKPAMTDISKIENIEGQEELMVFVQDGCGFCIKAEDFLLKNRDEFKNTNIVFYNLKDPSSQVKLFKNVSRLNIPKDGLGTPIFIIGDQYIVGFGEQQKSDLVKILNEKKIK